MAPHKSTDGVLQGACGWAWLAEHGLMQGIAGGS